MRRFAITLAALALAGCGGGADGNGGDAAPAAAPPQAGDNAASGRPPLTPKMGNLPAAENSVLDAPVPAPAADASVPEGNAAPDSAAAAADVVRSYLTFVENGRYADALALREPQPGGPTREQFVASFARFGAYHGTVGAPGRVDAGAGQRFVTVPVKVAGTLKDGGPFALAGNLVLHRTADIDGATAEQQRWRIRSADIAPEEAAALPASANARYRCVDGTKMAVRFDNTRDTAIVERDGRRLAVLTGQRPASGIWYRSAGYELRGKGRDAMFTQPGLPPMPCRAISSS